MTEVISSNLLQNILLPTISLRDNPGHILKVLKFPNGNGLEVIGKRPRIQLLWMELYF